LEKFRNVALNVEAKYKFAPWVCKSQDFFNTFILIYPYLYTVAIIIIIINYIAIVA